MAVGNAERLERGREPRDPERAVVALFYFAADIRLFTRHHHGTAGQTPYIGAFVAVSFREFKNFFMASFGDDASFDAHKVGVLFRAAACLR